MEEQIRCTNCGATKVKTKTMTVDRRTGKRINKAVSWIAAGGLLFFGGCMMLGSIPVALMSEQIEALWLYLGFGALFLVPGAIVLARYLRADKAELAEHTCTACQHKWKEVASSEAAVEGAPDVAQRREIVTLEGWQPGILGGQPLSIQIELAPQWVLLTIPGKKLRIQKEGAATRIVFPDAPFSGKGKAEHLDGLPVVHFENVKNVILQPEVYEQLRVWVPQATTKDRLKKELRNWGGSLIFVGIAHFAYASTLSPVWGGVLVVLGILNLIIVHRVMFILNGIALIIVAIMNLVGGGVWIVLGILQIFWAIAEFRKFAQYTG